VTSKLEDLALLVAVADHGSFTAAAQHAGTTQSRVSRAIARLEAGLGQVLVRRSSRRVALTPSGDRLAVQARRAIRELSEVEAELRQSDGMAGRLVLSTPPALGRRLLAPILGAFCRANPQVRLDWSLGARRVDLIGEEVDVAVRFGPLDPTWERVRRLLRGKYHLYAAPGVAEGRELPGALASLPCIGFHATHLRDRWPLRVNGQVTWIQVEPLHWTDDVDALIGLAVAGLGVTLLPDLLVTPEVEQGLLVRLTDAGASLPAEVYANLGAQRPTERARALVESLAEALAMSSAIPPGST